MNCFEWQSRASDYLDGSLPPPSKRAADEHLDECNSCMERYKHYRLILTSIAGQPRSALPVPIRKSPLSAVLPRMEPAMRVGGARRFTWWERIPWYFRIPLEGAGIVMVILVGISAGPKLRAIYERRIEHNLNEFSDSSQLGGLGTDASLAGAAAVPLARGRVENADTAETEDDFSSGEGDSDAPDAADSAEDNVRAGSSELWRFNVRTDSPHDFRPKIVQLLTELGIPSTTEGFGGIEAPGGIQFDLLVPQSIVPEMKKHLEKLAPQAPDDDADSVVEDGFTSFTWYKNKSKKPIPHGKTRVVIWLSQT